VSPSPTPSGERVRLRVRGEVDAGTPPVYDLLVRVRSARSGKIVFSVLGTNCGVGELGPGPFELEVELQLNVGQGIYSVETAVNDSSRRQVVASGPSTHLRVSQSTTFGGGVQMNPAMRVVRQRAPRLVVAAEG
jgi:hypothetical protein